MLLRRNSVRGASRQDPLCTPCTREVLPLRKDPERRVQKRNPTRVTVKCKEKDPVHQVYPPIID